VPKQFLVTLCLLTLSFVAAAERISDVSNTKHNFSAQAIPQLFDADGSAIQREVAAVDEVQICAFCHTPHGANTAEISTPLWNRQLSSAQYEVYGSNIGGSGTASLDAEIPQPNGASKLCLSCHDGTLAVGAVNVLNGTTLSTPLTMSGTASGGQIPAGMGQQSGYTRNLGTNLTNDHPISMVYDENLVELDGELRPPTSHESIYVRRLEPMPANVKNSVHLEPTSQTITGGLVQCNSCHDPHIRDTQAPNIKFLRMNRLQGAEHPLSDQLFSATYDIICLACHEKAGWAGSAHANRHVADETYTDAAAQLREFPSSGDGTQVWESSCLACHDTHTVQGSRRLLREGTDDIGTPKQGGNPALEETCYACHSSDGNTLTSQGFNTEVPDIKSEFSLPRHMPITSDEQGNYPDEVHDIGSSSMVQAGKDFLESPANLGKASAGGSLANRHAECTDCHNPHRVTKTRYFYTDPFTGSAEDDMAAGTHNHNAPHSNIASGVLRGTWGVEPIYMTNNFHDEPLFDETTVKRGNPPVNASTDVGNTFVTREYQVCLKCHSNYAYDQPPELGAATPMFTNGMVRYTNQAREFNSPQTHADEPVSLGVDGGAGNAAGGSNNPDWDTNNHRSWHPVMRQTGRTAAERQANADNWLPPFNAAVGTQTMYCSDCHGSNTNLGTVVPGDGSENSSPWGPHGSTNDFILKGPWSGERNGGTGELQGSAGAENHLCFKCHDFDQYANPAAPIQQSGFSTSGMCGGMCGGMFGMSNLHIFHANQVTNFRCNFCHVAVPHGWKNKNFLVNLNDIGPESTNGDRGEVRNGTTQAYTNAPYYNRAVLKVNRFVPSGQWNPNNCGSAGIGGNQQLGVNWMAFSTEACNNVP
jgi:hypothetical protein